MGTRPQFSLTALLFVVVAVAVTLGIGRWVDLDVAIALIAIPICLVSERLLVKTEQAGDLTVRPAVLATLVLLSLSTVPVAWASFSWGHPYGIPSFISPFPHLVSLPLEHFSLPRVISFAVPAVCYWLMHYDVAFRPARQLPARFTILLGLATGCSVAWFVAGFMRREDALRVFDFNYRIFEFFWWPVVTNVMFIVVLWCLWGATRRRVSSVPTIVIGALLHYWLFWCAFPGIYTPDFANWW